MKKQIITMLCIFLGAVIIFSFRFDLNDQHILTTLKAECNCENIGQASSLHGISFSKKAGMNLGDTYIFTLQNCTFDSFEKDIDRLTQQLSSENDNFGMSDVVILEFKDGDIKVKEIKIKNCEWVTL